MSYQFYKILHVFGLSLLFLGFGWLLVANRLKTQEEVSKKWGFIFHGLGLTTMFISGFGLAARLGMFQNLAGWVHLKILLWVLLGLSAILLKRLSRFWYLNLPVILFITLVAMYSAIYKPL